MILLALSLCDRYLLVIIITVFCFSGAPSEPVIYMNSNNIFCYEAYTHPEYPIGSYSVTITIVNIQEQASSSREFNSTTDCVTLSDETLSNCTSIQVSVLASNFIGNSTSSKLIIEAGMYTMKLCVHFLFLHA